MLFSGLACCVLVACSGSDGSRSTSATSTTVRPPSAPADAALTTTATPTTTPASTSLTTVASSTSGTSQGTTTVAGDHWRFAIEAPRPGSTSPLLLTVCYDASGPIREPALSIEVVARPRSGESPTTGRAAITPGRGSVSVDLTAAGGGRVDLDVRLLSDGVAVDGAIVEVADVTLAAEAAAIGCN